jgi:hypothetical protein
MQGVSEDSDGDVHHSKESGRQRIARACDACYKRKVCLHLRNPVIVSGMAKLFDVVE